MRLNKILNKILDKILNKKEVRIVIALIAVQLINGSINHVMRLFGIIPQYITYGFDYIIHDLKDSVIRLIVVVLLYAIAFFMIIDITEYRNKEKRIVFRNLCIMVAIVGGIVSIIYPILDAYPYKLIPIELVSNIITSIIQTLLMFISSILIISKIKNRLTLRKILESIRRITENKKIIIGMIGIIFIYTVLKYIKYRPMEVSALNPLSIIDAYIILSDHIYYTNAIQIITYAIGNTALIIMSNYILSCNSNKTENNIL